MDKALKEKYWEFVNRFLADKICLSTKMKQKYGEKFFDDAVKDRILIEIDKNDEGSRMFIFSPFAKEILQ